MRLMHITRASLMMCQFMIPVINEQKKRGHYVCVCGSDDSDVLRLTANGIDVFPHRLERSLNPSAIVREIFRIKRLLIEQQIDAVICHTPLGAGIGRIAAKLAKVPHIVYFTHGMPCAPGQNRLKWLVWFAIEKILGKITSGIIVMNNYDYELCRKHTLSKHPQDVLKVPGMGVDLTRFAIDDTAASYVDVRKEFGLNSDSRIVLCVAYLIPEKGVYVLLDAARQVISNYKNTIFMIAGMGPEMENLRNLIKQYNLATKFFLLGWRNDIYRLMKAADIFTLPTYYFEGLPVSILEAMACGKPVVSTFHRGPEDIVINGKTGILVTINNSSALAKGIDRLLQCEEMRNQMGAAGRKVIEEHFELSYCTNEIVIALEKLIN